jgi:hypothetical protein
LAGYARNAWELNRRGDADRSLAKLAQLDVNDAWTLSQMGWIYVHEKRMAEGWEVLKKAATLNDAWSQFAVGKTLIQGCPEINLPADRHAGLAWIQRAADQGFAEAISFQGAANTQPRATSRKGLFPEYMQQSFLPVFVLGWFLVTGLLAYLSGWVALAARFRADGPVDGARFQFSSGSLGRRFLPVSYGNCLFVTVNPQGLRLAIFLPFRFLSPPLYISWKDIDSMTERRILFFDVVTFTICDSWVLLSLRGAPGRGAKEAYSAAKQG